MDTIAECKPDCIFNALHGEYGEDGRIQAVLDLIGIPYTHSNMVTSAICMDKQITKDILSNYGILVPDGCIMSIDEIKNSDISRPFVIKPVNGGSSIGTFIIKNNDVLPEIKGLVLCEHFVSGREFTVAVLDGVPLEVTEIIPNNGFYDYNNKYSPNGARHICPADINGNVRDKILNIAKVAYDKLRCCGLVRADFIYDGDNFYFLEINTQPGLTEFSLAPEQAAVRGISFSDLIVMMINRAMVKK